MRSFSSLQRDCNYPELIQLGHPRSWASEQALKKGSEFHDHVLAPYATSGEYPYPQNKDVQAWGRILQRSWIPPEGCESEIAVGLAAGDTPAYAEVVEVEPHVYISADLVDQDAWDAMDEEGRDAIKEENDKYVLTAGRLDLVWQDGNVLVVVDAKTSSKHLGDPWGIPQLVAQAVTAHCKYGSLGVRLGVYYARIGRFDFGQDRYGADVRGMFPQVKEWALRDSLPKLGAHCLSCYSAKECDAYQALKATLEAA
jgi:hypothetical protein